ncbi:hypothetical protein K8I85_10135 [bacterium]|nr:hypothetical protein [bacterium]
MSAIRTMSSDDATSPVAIPDDTSSGVVLGPLSVAEDAGAIRDVGLELGISHPCAGDVAA